jgi:serine phosphatase RsbU (regulator of sigma subunit)
MVAGGNYRSLGEFEAAVRHLLVATQKIDRQSALITYALYAHYQLGEIHASLNDLPAAERYFLDGVALANDHPDAVNGIFRLRSGLGGVYLKLNRFDEARVSLLIAKDMTSTPGQKGRVLLDLANLELARNELDQAQELATMSYELRIQHDLHDAAATSLTLLGKIQLKQMLVNEAITSFEEALELAIAYKAEVKKMELYKLLSVAYELKNEPQKSLDHLKEHLTIAEAINAEQQREIYKLKNQEITAQKKELEVVHEEIKASITYAKRIQKAILPPMSYFDNHLDAFVLYLPKDIVAGDFYWFEKVGNELFFAAADCTGHGVPGAMVSVICNNALNRSVREFGLSDTALILDKTREIVLKEFEKSEQEVKDGMDIALCKLVGPHLFYSGANNPLWMIRNGSDEVEETKANKQPIGKFDMPVPFSSHHFEVNTGDTFYIFSDGFADQFGGPKGKKFKAANFKKLLLSIQHEPMHRQGELLEKAINDWRGSLEQIDDICVIGFRV